MNGGEITTLEIGFPGGKQVEARFGPHRVLTDQPADAGGTGAAPGPFDLFLASIGTCAGVYALGFCQARGLSTQGLRIVQDVTSEEGLPSHVRLRVFLPVGFPDKYRAALLRAVESCKVKKTIARQPAFAVEVGAEQHAGQNPDGS
ncbi:MAG: OsmC family protein [Sandaracinaceae bacterium]|nr:OsmC family protein [Sandaracinaceae bacterium]